MTTKLTVDEVIKELKLEKKENHNIDTIIKEIRKEYTSSDTVVDLLKYWTKQYETSSVHNLEIDTISDDNRYSFYFGLDGIGACSPRKVAPVARGRLYFGCKTCWFY